MVPDSNKGSPECSGRFNSPKTLEAVFVVVGVILIPYNASITGIHFIKRKRFNNENFT